jgi:hypothetical protein
LKKLYFYAQYCEVVAQEAKCAFLLVGMCFLRAMRMDLLTFVEAVLAWEDSDSEELAGAETMVLRARRLRDLVVGIWKILGEEAASSLVL